MAVSIATLRALAAAKGLMCERHHWRDRVLLRCANGVPLRWYLDGYGGSTAFGLRHALRFLRGLPDAD